MRLEAGGWRPETGKESGFLFFIAYRLSPIAYRSLILLALLCVPAYAQESRTWFEEGNLLYRDGRYEEALPLYREALEIAKTHLGEDHPSTLRNMNNMGLFLQDMKRWGEAEAMLRRALEMRRETLGPENPGTLASAINLSLLYARIERYDETLRLGEETVEISRRTLGEEHLYTIIMDGILARAHTESGNQPLQT